MFESKYFFENMGAISQFLKSQSLSKSNAIHPHEGKITPCLFSKWLKNMNGEKVHTCKGFLNWAAGNLIHDSATEQGKGRSLHPCNRLILSSSFNTKLERTFWHQRVASVQNCSTSAKTPNPFRLWTGSFHSPLIRFVRLSPYAEDALLGAQSGDGHTKLEVWGPKQPIHWG